MVNFTQLADVPHPSELMQLARSCKLAPQAHSSAGKNKVLGLLFFNPSMRTRLSTQRAAINLGMEVVVMDLNKDGWQMEFQNGAIMNSSSQEHIKEAAAVISRYCDVIGIRTFASLNDREHDYAETILSSFLAHATVPIVSLESAIRHPLQSLADWLTIETLKTVERPKVVLTWAPHVRSLPQAVPNSFLEWMKIAQVDLVTCQPKGFELAPEFSAGIASTSNQQEALEGADFVYVKNWSSYQTYGQVGKHADWMITREKLALTRNAKLMHCLPVRRNVVISDCALDSTHSVVIEQAENRIYAAQAVLLTLLKHETNS